MQGLASIVIFPVITVIVIIIGAATKWIDMSAFNLKPFILMFGSTLLINFIKNIFGETVWRGYLTSQLIKLNLNFIVIPFTDDSDDEYISLY